MNALAFLAPVDRLVPVGKKKTMFFLFSSCFFSFQTLPTKIPRTVPLSPEMAAKSLSASSTLGNSLGKDKGEVVVVRVEILG